MAPPSEIMPPEMSRRILQPTKDTITPQYKLHKNNIVVGTWNVRTLYACGKVKELTHELARYSWDILGLAEVR
jgi:hypothetical protein